LMEKRKREKKSSPFDSLPLLLFGKKKEVADQFKSVLPAHPLTEYLAGKLSDEEFLKPAGKNPLWLCGSHFVVGSARLADGDRKGAHKHFEKAVATRFYGHMFYPYARAFLARMDRDEKWPEWLPVKK